MNQKIINIIITVIVSTFVMYGCENHKNSTKLPTGVLSVFIIDENILNRDFQIGMTQNEIESKIGKAFKYTYFNNSEKATYFIDRPISNKADLIGFTFVYKNKKVVAINKSWMGTPE